MIPPVHYGRSFRLLPPLDRVSLSNFDLYRKENAAKKLALGALQDAELVAYVGLNDADLPQRVGCVRNGSCLAIWFESASLPSNWRGLMSGRAHFKP